MTDSAGEHFKKQLLTRIDLLGVESDEVESTELASFELGARAMLSHLLRASRPLGFRVVCGLKEEEKEENARKLLESFFRILDKKVDLKGATDELVNIALDVTDPLALVGDTISADHKVQRLLDVQAELNRNERKIKGE